MKKIFFSLILFLSLFLVFSNAQADVIRVPEDYPTIQQGINAAVDGDTVLVNDGVYQETIDFLGKAITVRSVNGPSATTIERVYPLTGATVTFNSAEGQNSILEGFTIRGGESGFSGGGVYCDNSSSPTIRNNRIVFNNWYGINCYDFSSPVIENNIIRQNGTGIACTNYSSPVIKQNIIFGNDSDGIATYSGSAPQIIENIISGNDVSGIECNEAPNSMLIKNNVITGNQFGIFCYDGSLTTIKNNIIVGGRFGIYCSLSSSPVIDYNDVWDNSGNYASCSPGPNDISQNPLFEEYTVTVLPDQSPTIQQAIEAVPYRLGAGSPCIGAGENGVNIGAYLQQASYGSPGEFVINVQSGLYQESIVLSSYIQLLGEQAKTTIIDPEEEYNVVVITVNGGRDNIISGFTIQDGTVGIKCNNSANPYINGNIITSNGKGVQTDYNSSPTVTGNIIIANSDRGMYCVGPSSSAHPTISNNTITGNGGRGIDIGAYNSPDILNNIITANGGDGIFIYDINTAGLRNIKNNIITNNSSHGINFGWHAQGNVTNNVIASNGASGIYRSSEAWSCTLKNNIVIANVGYGIESDSNWSNVTSDYNDVWNNTMGNYGGYAQPGFNDISVDSLFINPDVGHYSLVISSPCIDTGDPQILDPDQTRSNMGAFGGPEAKIVNLTLFSDMTQVQLGATLGYTVLLSNNFSDSQEVRYGEEIILPNGRLHLGNMLAVSLNPYQTIEHLTTFDIPLNAPLGNYTYIGKTGTHEAGVIDESSFDFEVVNTFVYPDGTSY